jgi:hypothetical protein
MYLKVSRFLISVGVVCTCILNPIPEDREGHLCVLKTQHHIHGPFHHNTAGRLLQL